MNSDITCATIIVIRGIGLRLAKVTFWSALVIALTLLALPGLVIWITSAYLLSFSALLLDLRVKGKIIAFSRNLAPGKLLRKASMR